MLWLVLVSQILAATIRGTIGQELELDPNTQIIVDGKYRTFVKQNGDFRLDGIPSGTHVLQIQSLEYYFDPVPWIH
jgi:hypothetical protein